MLQMRLPESQRKKRHSEMSRPRRQAVPEARPRHMGAYHPSLGVAKELHPLQQHTTRPFSRRPRILAMEWETRDDPVSFSRCSCV
jgi:hypothetical protein